MRRSARRWRPGRARCNRSSNRQSLEGCCRSVRRCDRRHSAAKRAAAGSSAACEVNVLKKGLTWGRGRITLSVKMPHADRAVVDRAKISEYLLNAAHPDNGGKAKFFEDLGFS